MTSRTRLSYLQYDLPLHVARLPWTLFVHFAGNVASKVQRLKCEIEGAFHCRMNASTSDTKREGWSIWMK
jgi:hypothetical protein